LVSIADSAVLLIRDHGPRIQRIVLAGSDPLELRVSDAELHILHFVTSAVRAGSDERRVEVYAWSASELTETLGLSALSELVPKLPFKTVFLRIRADPWFISDIGYPLFPPFSPEFAAPTKEQYVASRWLGCIHRPDDSSSCTLFTRNR
jgi:hypothetical protein